MSTLDRTGTRPVGSRPDRSAVGWPVVVGYALLAYASSWACWLPLLMTGRVVRVGGSATHLPGLLGPALAALLVAAVLARRGRPVGMRARLTRWRIGRWWLVACSPLAMVGLGAAVAALAGDPPAPGDFGLVNGFPQWGVVGVLGLLVLVNGLGEETGWRGFLQPRLQRGLRPLVAVVVLTGIWVGWHLPLFAVLSSYRGFSVGTLVGFTIGILCGAVVLGWLWNRTGSVPAVAVWHALYNLGAATVAATGTMAAVVTTLVIGQAVVLVVAELVTGGRVFAPVPAARDSAHP
ncbi:CPBP family intramembrane glutamic endopeptidase [Micromonospora cathayae]|uniref:CPBP family intramembrane metalloprotease n=1 Tax=Micromonospora cathayae TaxID=3028804 RepID=A0ABY7ZKX5_9ACTN|nr:CPBP family intramembrane glutamic endopeptidase [Micromonospora sp. HUAS 3]WDZ83614.1 CPBP family intramembrane metalloprotease [Micromonospora sp. HUAS 3]